MSNAETRKPSDPYVHCTVCGLPKKPLGRDSLDTGLCQTGCEGYRQSPEPSTYWPGERDADPRDALEISEHKDFLRVAISQRRPR